MPGDDAGPYDSGSYDAGPSLLDGGFDVGCVPADLDLDGVTTCAGDCDDGDPTVYPLAPMICGDGVDNGCLTDGEEAACLGTGTYVSVDGGLNSNPGTQAEPVGTIAQGLANANTIGGNVDVYVAEGRYDEDITMVESHSIRCGYEDSGWTRDSMANVSDLRPANNFGVIFPSGVTNLTVLEGCTVRGLGSVTASVAVSFQFGASGVLRENQIIGGDNRSGMSTAIAVYPLGASDSARSNTGTPVIEGNVIQLGESASGWSPGRSGSFGIWSARTEVVIDRNTVNLANWRTSQRAIALRNSILGSQVIDNRVRPTGGRSDVTYGLRIVGGSVSLSRNDVHAGRCEGWCVAVEVTGALDTVSFTNNLLYGGESRNELSAALVFTVEGSVDGATLDVLVHSNLIVGGDSGSPAVGVGWWGDGRTNRAIGRLRNNIVYAGRASQTYAMWEEGTTLDPELLEANALWSLGTTEAFRPTVYFDEGGSALTTAMSISTLPEHRGFSSLAADCQVMEPWPDGDPHIMASSPCIDAGTSEEAPSEDWERDLRPRPPGGRYDIGHDEF